MNPRTKLTVDQLDPTPPTEGNYTPMIGRKFGRLTVTDYLGKYQKKLFWQCICDCGTEKMVCGNHLRRGATRSCGCWANELTAHRNTTRVYKLKPIRRKPKNCTPKERKHPLYSRWLDIRLERSGPACDRWKDSFDMFVADVGECPEWAYALGRLDTSKPFEPGNVRWMTRSELGQTKSRLIRFMGRSQSIMQWSEETGMSYDTLHGRLYDFGWSIRRALTVPPEPGTSELERMGSLILTDLGIAFETQRKFGWWVVDAYIPSARLVIQWDGDYWHGHPAKYPKPNRMQRNKQERDARCVAWFEARGYHIRRFWECDVLGNTEWVVSQIRVTLDECGVHSSFSSPHVQLSLF